MTLKELWESAAELCSINYGSYVDWEEEFFLCPYCLEPIYYIDLREDWDGICCPVCEEILEDCDDTYYPFGKETDEDEDID